MNTNNNESKGSANKGNVVPPNNPYDSKANSPIGQNSHDEIKEEHQVADKRNNG